MKKRPVDLVIISDVHLGTYGCHAAELVQYMKSIKPGMVVLNGDFIDMWQFNKNYFPHPHMQVIKQIVTWINKDIKVYYITGNHDEMLRKFAGFNMGTFTINNKLLLELDGKKIWIFHGDVFDVTMQHSKWLTRLGSHGYDLLILINAFCNWISVKMGRGKISLSRKIKNAVKSAVSYINNFEETCADVAIANGYDYVICGHIHHPEMKLITTHKGKVNYLNSGDWVENLTAIEFHQGIWKIYKYDEATFPDEHEEEEHAHNWDNKQIFNTMLKEFNLGIRE